MSATFVFGIKQRSGRGSLGNLTGSKFKSALVSSP